MGIECDVSAALDSQESDRYLFDSRWIYHAFCQQDIAQQITRARLKRQAHSGWSDNQLEKLGRVTPNEWRRNQRKTGWYNQRGSAQEEHRLAGCCHSATDHASAAPGAVPTPQRVGDRRYLHHRPVHRRFLQHEAE